MHSVTALARAMMQGAGLGQSRVRRSTGRFSPRRSTSWKPAASNIATVPVKIEDACARTPRVSTG